MKEFFQKIPRSVFILTAIVLVGIFLRAYHFHAFLDFENDQVRDANLVRNVLQGKTSWPLLGPDMTGSGRSHNSGLFYVGPAYYYFEIISAKIFGDNPAAQAYPNLLFAILSLPLFYIFFRRYFSSNLTLALTGLYAISYYAILYARFSWNSNPIPFFTLLFLLCLHEFLLKKEKTHWGWAIILGVAVGIGFQLHLILIALFPATAFFVFLFLFFQNKKIWKPLVLAVLIAIVLNVPQIVSEVQHNYSNTHTFIKDMIGGDRIQNSKKNNPLVGLGKAVDCHVEANVYMTASTGSDVCVFSYAGLSDWNRAQVFLGESRDYGFWTLLIAGFLFSLFGYGLLVGRCFGEKDESKKYFLCLIALYLILSFFIMTSVISGGFVEFRYFIHTFFLPFLFLGLIAEFLLQRKFRLFWLAITTLIFLTVAAFNAKAIAARDKLLAAKDGSNEHFVILGEVEPMVSYLMDNSAGQNEAQLDGNPRYLSNFFNAFSYLAGGKNFTILRITHPYKIVAGKPLFYITMNGNNPPDMKEDGHKIEKRQNFGQVTIYQLANP